MAPSSGGDRVIREVIDAPDGRYTITGEEHFRTDDYDLACYVADELNHQEETRLAGKEVTPKDAESTARLMNYWAHGEGAAKIKWGAPGDFNRCRLHLGKYVPAGNTLDGLCANLHHKALGVWPGQEHGGSKSHAQGSSKK